MKLNVNLLLVPRLQVRVAILCSATCLHVVHKDKFFSTFIAVIILWLRKQCPLFSAAETSPEGISGTEFLRMAAAENSQRLHIPVSYARTRQEIPLATTTPSLDAGHVGLLN